MASTTVRVNEETRATLRKLAAETKRPMQDVLAQAVEGYRRQLILEGTNSAYAKLRSDRVASGEDEEERQPWEATLSDGLERG